jgi:predicted aldo/keto reductase-like oxidoreductase
LLENTKRIALSTANLSQEYGGKGKTSSLGVSEAEKIIKYILNRGYCSIETSSQYDNAEKILEKFLSKVQFEKKQ